jgi:hypothetical protein
VLKSFPIVVVLIFEQHGKGDNDDEENEEEDGNLLAEANPEGCQRVAGGRSPFALNDHRNAAFEGKHPGRGARPAVAEPDRDWRCPIELWHPAGVREQSDAVFRWSFGAKRTTTGYLLPTLRVGSAHSEGWQGAYRCQPCGLERSTRRVARG